MRGSILEAVVGSERQAQAANYRRGGPMRDGGRRWARAIPAVGPLGWARASVRTAWPAELAPPKLRPRLNVTPRQRRRWIADSRPSIPRVERAAPHISSRPCTSPLTVSSPASWSETSTSNQRVSTLRSGGSCVGSYLGRRASPSRTTGVLTDAWGAGLGGNVIGVHLFLRYKVDPQGLETSRDTVRKHIERTTPL